MPDLFEFLKTSTLAILILLGFWVATPAFQIEAHAQSSTQEAPEEQPFSSLNVRMSNRPISPPSSLILQTIPLTGLTVARPFEGPPPRAAIIEDDRRQRVALISEDAMGSLQLYLLEPFPLDPQVPGLFQCASHRQCATDRMPLTGGLACLALCLKDILESSALNPREPNR